jgi:mannitol-1-phosphate 5-dehydrogenase
MSQKRVIIWGAGRIGRGFAADLFFSAGYCITFIDVSHDLIEQLKRAGQYTIVRAQSAAKRDDLIVRDYDALAVTEVDAVSRAVADTDLVVLAVFPRDFGAVVEQLTAGLRQRRVQRPEAPLDIILCTNLAHAAVEFRARLSEVLPPDLRDYAEKRIGVVESLVTRMVADPPAAEREREPLLVWTNGNAEFPVDRHAFRGQPPQVMGLRLVEDMRAEEMRKLYTYNTCHAALAYLGALRSHELIVDCLADPTVRSQAERVLEEVAQALQAEYGFDAKEMEAWIARVIRETDNPTLGDRVSRHGADPVRKLRRSDRLIGPLLMARKHGIPAPSLTRATAAAFLFRNPCDPGAVAVQERVRQSGIESAVRELCELTDAEADLVAAIVEAYRSLKTRDVVGVYQE